MPPANFTQSCQGLIGHRIDNGRLEFQSVLGLGAYGVVYLALDVTRSTPAYYAVKCLNNVGLDARQRHFQRRELALHRLASSHASIVSLYKIIETPSIVYVIMEYCNGGDLFGMITEKQRYIGEDALISKVFLQILDAVDHCHDMGVMHRDLKPENIMCMDGGERVLLADFGLATSEKISTDFGCGSTFYMSPETHGGVYERVLSYATVQNDIWSLAVILTNLCCGRNPWRQATPSDETFRAFLQSPNFLQSILPISNECNEVLKRMFEVDPTKRIGLKELRRMVKGVGRWTMTEDELAVAHDAARKAAEASGSPAAERLKIKQAKAEEERKRRQEAAAALAAAQAANFCIPPPALINIRAARPSPILASPFTSRSVSRGNPFPEEEEDAPWNRRSNSSSNETGSTYADSDALSFGASCSPRAVHPSLRRPAQIHIHSSDAISERRISSTSTKVQSPSSPYTFGTKSKYLSPPASPLRPAFAAVHPGAHYTSKSSFGASASSASWAPPSPEIIPFDGDERKKFAAANAPSSSPSKPHYQRHHRRSRDMDEDDLDFLALPTLEAHSRRGTITVGAKLRGLLADPRITGRPPAYAI